MGKYSFYVNGELVSTDENKSLLRFLRDDLHLTSVKDGCSEGACGTCTVVIDGIATKGCVMTTKLAQGKQVLTVEGLEDREKEAFVYAFGAVGAVQCGFCIPGMVMSGAALVRQNPNPTDDEVKWAIRGNVCRCTGYKKIIEGIQLAAAVLRGDAQIDDSLERGDDYGVGKRAFRADVRRKVLGYGKYPDDLTELDFPGMLYGSCVRSPHPRARVLRIDSSKAEALPGVVGVLKAQDVPVNQVGHLIRDWDVFIAEGDITRCVGDALCLVVAEDEATLAKAKRLVKVDYEVLEPVRNIDEAAAPGAPIIHESFNAFGNHVVLHDNVCQSRHVTRGNAAEALAHSAHVVTRTFETPFTEHAFLEPECAVSIPYKDGVKVYSTDQGRLRHAARDGPHVWLGRPEGPRGCGDHAGGRRLRRQGGRDRPAHLRLGGVQVPAASEVQVHAAGVPELPPQAPLHARHLHTGLRRRGQLHRPGLRDQL